MKSREKKLESDVDSLKRDLGALVVVLHKLVQERTTLENQLSQFKSLMR